MSQPCEHSHEPGAGLTGAALAAQMAAAEARCAHLEQRLTEPRRRVLSLLLAAGAPVKAYDLIGAYGLDGAAAKPPTVYRALDFLVRQGFVHRIESLNAYVACRHVEAGSRQDGQAGVHGAAFLICGCCGAAREIEPPAPQALEASALAAGYSVHAVMVEAHGLCGACRA